MKQNKTNSGDSSNQKGKKGKDEFPGYPYSDKEDLKSNTAPNEYEDGEPHVAEQGDFRPVADKDEDMELEMIPGTEADVTDEELDELGREGLQDRNFHPDELDVPGSKLDDDSKPMGDEDEENNYYSLGGDDMENLEENPDR